MVTQIPFQQLELMTGRLRTTHQHLTNEYQNLTRTLESRMAEWGSDTSSRQAYNTFKANCDKNFEQMTAALAKIGPALETVRSQSMATESRNAATFNG